MIPDEKAWKGYEDDLDFKYFHELAYGKSNDDMQSEYGKGYSIERAGELQFVSQPIFEYYIKGFCQFILSEKAKNDSDSASSFLGLLEVREEQRPGSVCKIFDNLKEALIFVQTRQEYFDADQEIYGDFYEKVESICDQCQRKL